MALFCKQAIFPKNAHVVHIVVGKVGVLIKKKQVVRFKEAFYLFP